MVTPVIQAGLLLSNKHVAVTVTHTHKQVFEDVAYYSNIFLSQRFISQQGPERT